MKIYTQSQEFIEHLLDDKLKRFNKFIRNNDEQVFTASENGEAESSMHVTFEDTSMEPRVA